MPTPLFRLALAAALLLLPGSALAAAGYTLRAIALEGSPAPGTSDAFGDFLDVSLDESGRVAFSAPLASGFPNAGVWVDPGSGPVLRTRNGQAAPSPHPGSFLAFGNDGTFVVVNPQLGSGNGTLAGFERGCYTSTATTLTVSLSAPCAPDGLSSYRSRF